MNKCNIEPAEESWPPPPVLTEALIGGKYFSFGISTRYELKRFWWVINLDHGFQQTDVVGFGLACVLSPSRRYSLFIDPLPATCSRWAVWPLFQVNQSDWWQDIWNDQPPWTSHLLGTNTVLVSVVCRLSVNGLCCIRKDANEGQRRPEATRVKAWSECTSPVPLSN